ncbi:MAG: TatD family hydrolase [Candidatus Paceibacterota bacterium]|jgi:TatD DNase family protein
METQDQIEKGIPRLVDAHAHLNFFDYEKDRKETVERSLEEGVWMINVGTNFQSSQKAAAIAEEYPEGVFAAIGLHPTNIEYGRFKLFSEKGFKKQENFLENDFDVESYETLAGNKKVVAVGEIGLDYFYKPKDPADLDGYRTKQKEILEKQLDFAEKMNLPAIIHCRDAHNEMIAILEQRIIDGHQLKGVIHCFNGTSAQAEKYLALGLFIGINGIIFKMDLSETIKKIPLEKMILETDCPFLVPPMAGSKRNEPGFLPFTAEKLLEIKGIDFETASKITTQNSRQLFKLK